MRSHPRGVGSGWPSSGILAGLVLAQLTLAGCDAGEAPASADPAVETSAPATDSGPPALPFACPCPDAFDPAELRLHQVGDSVGIVYGPGPWRDELVLFLHGSGQAPSNHTSVMQAAAYAGYRVVGVRYPSTPQIVSHCEAWPDERPLCYEQTRQARIYGAEYPTYDPIADDRSIVGQLHAWLLELDALAPDEGWGAYADPAEGVADHEHYLHWERIVVAGFSQGAGHAAMLARDEAVDGAVLISGPADPEPDWVRAGATPACAVYAVHHQGEGFAPEIDLDLARLGLPEEALHADVAQITGDSCFEGAPYGGSHHFESALPPRRDDGCPADDPLHGSMANDPCLNLDDAPAGDPFALFRPYVYAFCAAGAVDAADDGCTDPWAPARR